MMLKARDAAIFLGISTRAFYDLHLPCYRMGKRLTRWSLTDLEEYKTSCRITSTSPSNAGAGPSCGASTDAATAHRNFSRLVGLGRGLKPSTARKQRAS